MPAASVPAVPLPPYHWRSWQVTGLHLLLLVCLGSACYCFGIINYLPAEDNLRNWDVIWYEQLRDSGYVAPGAGLSDVAFFPLFPYVWRWLGVGRLGMALLNAGLFTLAATWLARQLAVPARLQLLWLSTPVLLFMAVPYSEAFFFAFGAMLLVGLRRRQLGWWLLGLLGCGLTRSASSLFVPALAFTMLLWASQPGQWRTALRWGLLGLLVLLVTTGAVAYMQWQQVGDPLAFAHIQSHWGHQFGWPNWPLHDPAGIDLLWIDSLGLWLSVVATGCCGWLLWQAWERRRSRSQMALPPLEVLFSLGYYAMTAIFLLLFQGGSLWNAARYTLTAPFLLVLLGHLATLPAWRKQRYLLVAVATLVGWQLFGVYTQDFDSFTLGQGLWYFGMLTGYLLLYLAWRQLRWQGEATMLLYTTNVVLLLHLFDTLLQGAKIQ